MKDDNYVPQSLPIKPANRVVSLDVIRGFALIGILLMNIEWFNRPLSELGQFDINLTGFDWAVSWFIKVFVEGKFWKLFTLLFGMGFAIMIIKAQATNRPFIALFSRRLIFLFCLGLIHMIFMWGGDILNLYAIGGLMMLAWISIIQTKYFKRFNKPTTFLRIGLFMLIFPMVIALLSATYLGLTKDQDEIRQEWLQQQEVIILASEPTTNDNLADKSSRDDKLKLDVENYQKKLYKNSQRSAKEVTAFTQENFWVATSFRIDMAIERLKVAPIGTFFVGIPVFMLGYWLIASGIMRKPEHYIVFYKSLAWLGTGFGIFFSIAGVMISLHPATEAALGIKFVSQGLFSFGKDVLAAGYLGILMLCIMNERLKHYLLWLAPMGRMALTNYLMHSLILTSIFYGYAGGMFGEIARGSQLAIVAIIILCQSVTSHYWLSYYQFGPLEWLWRSVTYLKLQPMKRYEEVSGEISTAN